MKRILIMILSLCLLCTFGFVNDTKANEGTCDECSEFKVAQTIEDIGEYYDEKWHEENIVENQPQTRAGTQLYVTKYYQNNYNNIMKTCNKTIASSGCALTAVTMVSNYLTGTNRNPAQVNTIMGNYACPLYWYEAASKLGMSLVRYTKETYSSAKSALVQYINSHNPVIVELKLANGTSHYVVDKGYSGTPSSYTFEINDPSSSLNKTTLNQYVNSGAVVKAILVYD